MFPDNRDVTFQEISWFQEILPRSSYTKNKNMHSFRKFLNISGNFSEGEWHPCDNIILIIRSSLSGATMKGESWVDTACMVDCKSWLSPCGSQFQWHCQSSENVYKFLNSYKVCQYLVSAWKMHQNEYKQAYIWSCSSWDRLWSVIFLLTS